MTITTQMIKELREETGAGMLDCKKALTETNGDVEAAVIWLNEKGLMKAADKNERVAAEGLTGIAMNDSKGVVFEINSETDFVAKNEMFLALIDNVGRVLLENSPATVEDALKIVDNGQTLEDIIGRAVAVIGEKISLRRFGIIDKKPGTIFGSYLHMGGTIAALALLEGTEDEQVGKDVAMHIAAISPLAPTKEDLPAEVVEAKRAELIAGVVEEGKPENIAEKIVEGRMGKFFSESVLEEQDFVKDPDMKVKEYLDQNNAKVLEFVTFTVGEGIEKEEEDFAAEVMSQIR